MTDVLPSEFTVRHREPLRGVTFIQNAWEDSTGNWQANGRIQILGLGITVRSFPPESIGEEQAAIMYERYTVIDE